MSDSTELKRLHREEIRSVTPDSAANSTSTQGLTANDLPLGYFYSKNFIGSVAGVCLMAISLYLGYVLPANTLTTINEDLGPDPNYILISTSYTLISGVGLLLVGRLGDIFGRRYFYIGGQTIGFIGAIVGATAQNIPTLIAGAVLTGCAASVQLTFTFVISELVPNKHRPAVNSGLFLSTLPFAAFGPLIAQLLVKNTEKGWRWNYYLNCITCGLSAILFALFYFPPGYDQLHKGKSRWEQVKKLDYLGLVLYSAGLVLVLLGLSWGGSSYPWKSGHVIATLVVGIVTLVLFALWETFAPLEQPFLPTKLLRNVNYVAVCVAASVGTMIYFSLNVLWPQQIAALYTTDPIKAGWLACTTGSSVALGQILAGLLMKPLGHARWQLVLCTVVMTTFLGAMASTNQYRKDYGIAFTIIGGLGVGFQEMISIIMSALICKPEDIGLASSFLAAIKQVVGTIATAIYVSILTNRLDETLAPTVTPAAVKAGLPKSSIPTLLKAIAAGTSDALDSVPGMTSKIAAVVGEATKTAYSLSFKTVYLTSIAFGGLAIIAAFFTRSIDDKMTSEVAQKLRGTDANEEGVSTSAKVV
ncbi:hypothetical protein DTO271D3_8880 [Paecilomyces variotii]|nr:hypothetical protein DTO271D3_8880 [Paecilomyces variotii]